MIENASLDVTSAGAGAASICNSADSPDFDAAVRQLIRSIDPDTSDDPEPMQGLA